MNAVRKSELKKIHNAKWSNIPPLRGADFLYKKIVTTVKLKESDFLYNKSYSLSCTVVIF